MTSSRRRVGVALAAPVVLAAAACGQGVHDLGVAAEPLVVLHGHVEIANLMRVHPEAALLGTLLWAAPGAVNPVCIRLADGSLTPNMPDLAQQLSDACPDPYGVFPGEAEAWSPIGDDGNFDLPLYDLPQVRVSVGDAVTRIAYGALVVVEDVNGDGQPPFARTPGRGLGRRAADDVQANTIDRIVASTFYDLHASQQRVVFREGGFVTPSYFYPAPGPGVGCTPPSAFSIETAPPYAEPATGDCAFSSTDDRLEVPPLSPVDGLAFLCRTALGNTTVIDPGNRDREGPQVGTGSGATLICFGSNVLATVVTGPNCPLVSSFALSGCAEDPLCAMPEWTRTVASLSQWDNGNGQGWPCP
jgi:hypothetical protein